MDRTTRASLLRQLIADAERLAAAFGLRYRVIEPERPHVRSRYGVCYADGTIRIRLRHAVTGRPLKYSSLVNTLCHELAHLAHFNHGPRFKALYFRILERARTEGIYRPGRTEPPARLPAPRSVPRGPAQLGLFEWVEERRRR
jgi:predicted metal-dependent hydrolase